MKSNLLVDTHWLEKNLNNDDIKIFDCTAHIRADPTSGIRFESGHDSYLEKHILGAGFLDVLKELSDTTSDLEITLPSKEQFSEAVSLKGISNDSIVVLYSTEEVQWATRVWWMFKIFGFDNVKLLDGGGQKWFSEGRPTSDVGTFYKPTFFTSELKSELIVTKNEVFAAIENNDTCIINSLSNPMFSGKSPLHFGRKGHIPSSVNLWFMDLINKETHEFLPLDEIKKQFDFVGVFDKPKCITYCGKGLAASANTFALSLLGHNHVSLYDGSMSEWAQDLSLPLVESE